MPRFFVGREAIGEDTVILTGENARHLSFSLRAAVGDEITVCDGAGTVYTCALSAFDGERVTCRILSRCASATDPPYEAVLCQALPKSDKMDLVIQKAVELGVSRIQPFESANCVAKIKSDAREKKTARWQRIADAAAGQCGRGVLPTVAQPIGFDALLAQVQGHRFFCYECGGMPLHEAFAVLPRAPGTVYFMIGPEGGFSPAEAERAQACGWQAVSLGARILRTETAGLYFLSSLSYQMER